MRWADDTPEYGPLDPDQPDGVQVEVFCPPPPNPVREAQIEAQAAAWARGVGAS